jgi:hypothetical protein
VGYSLAEGCLSGKFGVGMDLVVVARKTREVENITFGYGASNGNKRPTDFEFFEVQAAFKGR